MKIIDVRKLTTQQLAEQSGKLRAEIAQLKHSLYTGEVQNVKALRNKRKDLARVLTVLGENLTKETQ